MLIVTTQDIRRDWGGQAPLADLLRGIGAKPVDPAYLDEVIGLPRHLRAVVEALAREAEDAAGPRGEGAEIGEAALDSLPFYSLCKGFFLPLANLADRRSRALFGLAAPARLDVQGRRDLLTGFLAREIGLTARQKIACILGDPFEGSRSTFKRDSIIRLLQRGALTSRSALLDRMRQLGDVAALLAESRPKSPRKPEPPLTAAEVLHTLRVLPGLGRNRKFEVLESLLSRMGRLEAFMLAKLLLRGAALGFNYVGDMVATALATSYDAPSEAVEHALALADPFEVVDVLEADGADGLRQIQLQPLSAVRPALASAGVGGNHHGTDDIARFPVWVERKYDGVRLMLHKRTDAAGNTLAAAFTRNRNDWLEMIPGMEATIRRIPGHRVILDGELHGLVPTIEGMRPATVYHLFETITGTGATAGEPSSVRPVQLRYAAFDILYLDGRDLTGLPLHERRDILARLLAPVADGAASTPIPIQLADGQLANTKQDVNRLFQYFRGQGYEGIIAKDLDGPYRLATRDRAWVKRKPLLTIDVVLLAAIDAVTSKQTAGRFGSFAIGVRDGQGGFADIGDVAGVDVERDAQIQAEIARAGLLTGRPVERESASGRRTGWELLPRLVATLKMEGVVRDSTTGDLSLRDPKLLTLRPDKTPDEADTLQTLAQHNLKDRLG